jgi:hypothetical protein
VGWLDADSSGTVNQGDYSGMTSVVIGAGSNSLPEVLELKWMTSSIISSINADKNKINIQLPIY